MCVTVLQWKCSLTINFKVEKRENMDNAFYVFWHDTSKNVKSRVFEFSKKT